MLYIICRAVCFTPLPSAAMKKEPRPLIGSVCNAQEENSVQNGESNKKHRVHWQCRRPALHRSLP